MKCLILDVRALIFIVPTLLDGLLPGVIGRGVLDKSCQG